VHRHRLGLTRASLFAALLTHVVFYVCACRVQYQVQAKKRPEVQLPSRPAAVPDSPRGNRPLTAAERERERERTAARDRNSGRDRDRAAAEAARDRGRPRGGHSRSPPRGRSRSPPRRPSGGVDRDRGGMDRDRGYPGPPGGPYRGGSGRLPSPPRRGSGSG
jgi:hypothetical protein